MRRRRQYDATGAVQRESLAETAEILRRNDIDIAPLAAQLQIEHVLTAHPTEATRRSVLDHQWDVAALLDRLDDPRIGHARRRALLERAARGPDPLVADRRAAPDPPARRGRGPPQPVLLRGRPVRRRAGGAGRDRALARRPARAARALLRQLDRRRHGRPPGGRRRHARPRAAAAPHAPRCGSSATRVDRLARDVLALLAADPGLRGARRRRSRPTPQELPTAVVLRRPHREWEPLRTKLGFVHHRLGNTLTPARARARLRRRAGAAARPRARARPPRLAPRRARLDPPAAVAGRRLRLPPRRDRHPPGRGRPARGDGARSCPATATPTSRAARRC